jgi:hypothetical protein
VFDISNKYFITTGVRVDGNSAFGEGFGLQVYPKASISYVISDEGFWPESLGQVKLRTAYGQSGRAPGAFDAVRTWQGAGYAGSPAFVPGNVGNPDLGPEVTAEFEFGLDGSWANDRVSANVTYYNQTTSDALMNVTQIPSLGFRQSQLLNVGEVNNKGMELGLNLTPLETASYGWDVGINLTTNKSLVVDLGGAAEFNALGGRIVEGQPAPTVRNERITNPDAVADPVYEDDYLYGPTLPTTTLGLNTAIRLPAGITIAATAEYMGGNQRYVNPISIGRSVRSPLCQPFYKNEFATAIANNLDPIELRDDATALWRARCTPSEGEGYVYDADFFKLRTVSLTIPVGFALGDRVSGAVLTMSLNNSYLWMKDIMWMDTELLGNQGANATGLNASERLPSPITFRTSLRITF